MTHPTPVLNILRIATLVSLAVATGSYARAADITFMCADALQSSMEELIPEFRKVSGHNVKVGYANIGTNTERLRKGEEADLAIVSPQQWDSLQREGKIDSAVRVVIGKVGLGVFVKKGAPRPDITSVEVFKRALLSARSIAVRDPSRGSPVGIRTMALFDRLGIGGEIKPKIRLTADRPFEAVINGNAEIGFSTMTEIVATPDVDMVGPVPTELQNYIVFTAAVPAIAKQPAAAKALIEFLGSPRAVSVFKSKGFEPH